MTPLLRPVTKMKCSIPAALASSTTCWISGRSTTGSISFGMALVAGRNLVPRPATGKTAFRTAFMRPLEIKPDGHPSVGLRLGLAEVRCEFRRALTLPQQYWLSDDARATIDPRTIDPRTALR